MRLSSEPVRPVPFWRSAWQGGNEDGDHWRKFIRRHVRQHGSIASKTMVASAYTAHMVRRAADFGVERGECRLGEAHGGSHIHTQAVARWCLR